MPRPSVSAWSLLYLNAPVRGNLCQGGNDAIVDLEMVFEASPPPFDDCSASAHARMPVLDHLGH